MANKINSLIINEHKLILLKYSGSFNIADLINAKIELLKKYKWNTLFNILHDIRSVDIITEDVYSDYFEIYIEDLRRYNYLHFSSYLTAKPNQVVAGIFIAEMVNANGNNCKVFSTIEAACKHLNLYSDKINDIEDLFKSSSLTSSKNSILLNMEAKH